MPILGMRSLTLGDYAKRLGPDNRIGRVIEMLEKTNEVLEDAMFLEANNNTTHRTVIRTGLPESYWRTLNRGVPKSKSRTVQVDDRIGMLETWSVIDSALADLNGEQGEFLLSEELAFLESMNQEAAKTIFYGDLKDNAVAFHGLSPRYSTLDTAKAETAKNIVDAGGSGSNCTSAWLSGQEHYILSIFSLIPQSAFASILFPLTPHFILQSRKRFKAIRRIVDRFSAPSPLRVRLWSSSKAISKTQCKPFSTPQWSRTAFPKRLGSSVRLLM